VGQRCGRPFHGQQQADGETDNKDPFAGLVGTREASQKELDEMLAATQRVMWEFVGPLRTVEGMAKAVEKLTTLEIQADKVYKASVVTRASAGIRNAVRAAKEIALGALHSPVSIGTHFIVPSTPEGASAKRKTQKHFPV
jgi:aspartate oxidase